MGFLINLNINNGQVNWSKYIYKSSKKLKKEKIGDIVSLSLVSNQVLATTSNGYLLFINPLVMAIFLITQELLKQVFIQTQL